jgi:NitT/TauT family transport system permease protein/taurine transport system permease protein
MTVVAAPRDHRPRAWKFGGFALLAATLGAWEVTSRLILPAFDPQAAVLMPAPTTVAVTAGRLIASGELPEHLLASLRREAGAFLFAIGAVPLGIAMGHWRAVHEQLYPLLEVLRPIPPLAWIPLSILWFGLGDTQNLFIIFLGMVFPILINTIAAVHHVDRNVIRAARSLGADEWAVLTRVILPAALPQIVTGIRVGLGVGWMALVAAELVGASDGLGFLINDARSLLRTDIIIVGMLTIGLAGLTIDVGIRRLAARLLPWSAALAR